MVIKMNKTVKIIIGIFIVLALILSILGILVLVGNFHYGNKKVEMQITVEEAMQMAEQRIKQDYNYNVLNGYDLRLKADPVRCGPGCVELVYEYKVNQSKITGLEKIETSMVVEGGRINNMTYSEITKADKRIVSENGPERLCIDKCGDGVCDEMVCMGEGCPCVETIQNCPEDCR
jgi:hypothetical protein